MTSDPVDLKLDVVPRSRFDMVDLRGLVSAAHGAALSAYSHCLYWSSHTTAGFLDRSMASRLLQKPGVAAYIDAFRAIFPEGADYEHDRMDRRVELAPEQRVVEPRNADSHLAFIAAGLRTCVTYANKPDEPVCFVDLDGMNAGQPRRRHTRIIGYHREEVVARHQIEVPDLVSPGGFGQPEGPEARHRSGPGGVRPAARRPEGPLPPVAARRRAARGPHGERVRNAADEARPARCAARPVALRHREGPPRDCRSARRPGEDARIREI